MSFLISIHNGFLWYLGLSGILHKNQTQINDIHEFIQIFCPVAIMKKFVHLMLRFYWLRSTWRQANTFRCPATKSLQQNYWNEDIAMTPLQRSHRRVKSNFLLLRFSLFLSCDNPILWYSYLWYVLIYPRSKYINNFIFGSLPGILYSFIAPTSQTRSVLRPRHKSFWHKSKKQLLLYHSWLLLDAFYCLFTFFKGLLLIC